MVAATNTRKRQPRQDRPVAEGLCVRCPRRGRIHYGRHGLICRRCYEELRERTAIDALFADVLEANPEWERGPQETRSAYHDRMAAERKRLLAAAMQHQRYAPRPTSPIDRADIEAAEAELER